ncbi:MAG TPA: ABC transporter substrate-binding protein [Clostridia bacterium]|nr:ABC transporter substrate-binding protein [Clostridia bacterium]
MGCARENVGQDKNDMGQLKIGVLPVEDTMPLLVAEKNGYFGAENLQVELIFFQSPVEHSNAMQSGELNGMVTDMIVAALLRDSGLDLRITSITLGVTPEEGRFAIIASPESAIHKIQDLKGKSIGISYNSIIEFVTDGLLKEDGIDPSEVNKVSIPKIPVRMEMLFNNQVDAITVPDPLVTFAEFKGGRIVAQDQKKNLSQAVLLFNKKTLEENTEAVEAFYRAYTKAVEDLNNNPEDYKDLLIENANIPQPIAEDYQIQHYPKPQVPSEEDVNNVLEWMDQKGLLKNRLEYQDLVRDILKK